MGSNLLILRPGQGWHSRGAPQFSIADVDAIRDQIPGIADIAPFVQTNVPAVYQENERATDIQGTTANYFGIANWKIALGRFFTDEEVEGGRPGLRHRGNHPQGAFRQGRGSHRLQDPREVDVLRGHGRHRRQGAGRLRRRSGRQHHHALHHRPAPPHRARRRPQHQPDHDLRHRRLSRREHRRRCRLADARAPRHPRRTSRTISMSSTPSNSPTSSAPAPR